MSKIMVVEDDASLREIYSIRITAEGYDVVSAGDGEEALAMAVREKPDLILSDVMMPKISGFDMLDILRSTPETSKIKVVMMTALSADDQRARGERLGADRYLVKSQVGIEDVVNTIHEVLGDKPTAAPAGAPSSTPTAGSTLETPTPAKAAAPTTATPETSTPAKAAAPTTATPETSTPATSIEATPSPTPTSTPAPQPDEPKAQTTNEQPTANPAQ